MAGVFNINDARAALGNRIADQVASSKSIEDALARLSSADAEAFRAWTQQRANANSPAGEAYFQSSGPSAAQSKNGPETTTLEVSGMRTNHDWTPAVYTNRYTNAPIDFVSTRFRIDNEVHARARWSEGSSPTLTSLVVELVDKTPRLTNTETLTGLAGTYRFYCHSGTNVAREQLDLKDVRRHEAKGRYIHVEFFPGRRLTSLRIDTASGDIAIRRPSESLKDLFLDLVAPETIAGRIDRPRS